MNSHSPISLRLFAIIFAGILGLQAAWLLATELPRSRMPFFPSNKGEVDDVTVHRKSAAAAARIGWLRGELWVDYAISVDAELIGNTIANVSNDEAKLVTDRAVALVPYDSRAWLLLAMINAQQDWKDDKTLAQLKMSYYTSPNDVRLIPLRLQIATQSRAINDDELQGLVAHEMRTIIRHTPDMKQSIAVAYRGASPTGRHFIEEKLTELDPGFLTELRATRPLPFIPINPPLPARR
jgi:hypothetical protein